mgnify:CR=1 FL=1
MSVIVALSAIAYSLLKLADFSLPFAARQQRQSRLTWAAKGGIQYLMEQLAGEEADPRLSGEERQLTVGAVPVAVAIEDEGSKVNVNSASEKLLLGLDLTRAQAETLLDWRDLDSDCLPEGAERDYYLAKTDLAPRDGLLPVKEELSLLPLWQDEKQLIAHQLTVYGPLNVNAMSYTAFDALLAALDVDKFTSQAIVNDFIAAKATGQLFLDLESFFGCLPSLGPLLAQELEGYLTAEPVVNVNTATARVLRAWCHYLDLDPALAGWIQSARESAPFLDLTAIVSRLPAGKRSLFSLFFTTRSRVFALTARAGSVRLRVVVEKREGELAILSWQQGANE